MGKKPLFWARFKDNIIFGSELKALYNHPCFFKEIDISSLNKYLQYDYIPTSHTIWKNVFKLEPATYVVIKGNNIKKVKYWNPVFDEVDMSFGEAIGTLDRLISDAVEERLVADVPVGVFLSGGLDSSTILYYAKRMKQDIETFSIGFREKSFDESAYAEKVAKTLGSKHRNMIFGATDCIDVIETVLPSVDEPMADASIIPTYLLSNFVRKHVTVALGGDGGDELFSGYPTFIAHKMRNINIFPESFVRRSLDTVGSFLPASGTNFSIDFKMKSFTRGLQNIDSRAHEIWLGSYNEEERSQLFRKDIWNSLKNR
jgi:asparagine synthase (glutamine-hydrolysing)